MSEAAVNFITLREKIIKEREQLSSRLAQIADYAIKHPDDMALQTVAIIAERAQVHPSALIRFANHFGFSGFSQMQLVYKERLLRSNLDYGERIALLSSDMEKKGQNTGDFTLVNDFVHGSVEALQSLTSDLNLSAFEEAIHLLDEAEMIWLVGVRRCFPIVAYFNYAFSRLGKRSILLDGLGHMTHVQSQNIGKKDVVLALSFKDYAKEVLDIIEIGQKNGAKIVSITDSAFSPLVPISDVSLEIHEVEVHAFRSLSTSMCLALSMVVALGNRMKN